MAGKNKLSVGVIDVAVVDVETEDIEVLEDVVGLDVEAEEEEEEETVEVYMGGAVAVAVAVALENVFFLSALRRSWKFPSMLNIILCLEPS